MSASDVSWAARLMAQRRAVYESYSPVFWRRHPDATTNHTSFLPSQIVAGDIIALRTDHGFLIARSVDVTLVIDDFAVEDDDGWSADGRRLVIDAWSRRPAGTSTVRIVTAAADTPKVSMLVALGLVRVEQWWVKPVPDPQPTALAEPRPISTDTWCGILTSAPPVYDPGGPVLLVRESAPVVDLDSIEEAAQQAGAVIVVFPIPTGDVTEQHVRERQWSVASQWYSGIPVDD